MILRMNINFITGLLLAALSTAAFGSERRFTYTYESAVLNPGDRELEPWTTFRLGKLQPFTEVDQRVEFELGLLPGLQSSWYLNFAGLAEGSGGNFAAAFEF